VKSQLATYADKIRTDARLRKLTIWAAVSFVALGVFVFDSFPPAVPATSSSMKSAKFVLSKPISTGFIWVDVAGSVRHPGVYRLKPGDRLFSLIFIAGGFAHDAQQASVNLARTLTDGEQVIVASKNSKSSSGLPWSGQSSSAEPSKINVNSADETGVESLPGIGPTLGKRILDYRAKHGPFKSKADLENVPGLGPKLVAGMSDFVAY